MSAPGTGGAGRRAFGRIGVVGSVMTDLVTRTPRMPAPGETLEALGFAIGGGGKGANQAVAAARLGSPVLFVGRVGEDAFGRDSLTSLAADGIDTRHLLTTPGAASGVATILVEPDGENRILIAPGANMRLRAEDIEAAASELLACDLILLQLEIPIETVHHTIRLAHRHGRPVLLNPAPARPGLDPACLALVDFLVPNQSELALLTGLPTATRDEAAAAAAALRAHGPKTVIVTLGAEGALLVDAAGTRHIPSVPVTPVDTTGAGDAFIGSFAHHYLAGGNVAAALPWAARYAADAIRRPGARASFADAAAFRGFCDSL